MKLIKVRNKHFRVTDIVKYIVKFVCYAGIIYMSASFVLAGICLLFSYERKIYCLLTILTCGYALSEAFPAFWNLSLYCYNEGGLENDD